MLMISTFARWLHLPRTGRAEAGSRSSAALRLPRGAGIGAALCAAAGSHAAAGGVAANQRSCRRVYADCCLPCLRHCPRHHLHLYALDSLTQAVRPAGWTYMCVCMDGWIPVALGSLDFFHRLQCSCALSHPRHQHSNKRRTAALHRAALRRRKPSAVEPPRSPRRRCVSALRRAGLCQSRLLMFLGPCLLE